MACNCNNIYPDCDMNRWEVCQSIDILTNYYTKSEIDEKLDDIVVSGSGVTVDEVQEIVDENLDDYYTKDEVDSGFTTVNNELDNKLDVSAYTPTDLSNYWTSAQTKNYVDSVITDNSDIFVVNWASIRSQHIMTDELWNNLMNAIDNNKPIFGYIENQPNAIFDEIYPLQAFAMDVYGIKNIMLTLVARTYSTTVGITKNGSEDYTIDDDGFEFQTKLIPGSGISIDENNVISVSGGTTDLSQYWTSAQTKNYVDTAISGIPSGALAVDWSELVDQQLMTDAKWNEIVTAIQNHREVYAFLDYSADGGGIDIYPLTSSANIGAQGSNDSIILINQSGDGKYILTITKNGSNDYSFSESGYSFQPRLTAGSGISINNNVISVTGGTSGTIDQNLDSGSTNAVANSAITNAINAKADASNVYTKTEVNNLVGTKANVWCGDEASFNALTTKDANTIYLVY